MQYASLLVVDSHFYTTGITGKNTPPYEAKAMYSELNLNGDLINYLALNDSDIYSYGMFLNTLSTQGDSLIKLFGYIEDSVGLFPILWTVYPSGHVKRATIYPDSNSVFCRGDYLTKDNNDNYYLACNYQYANGTVDACILKVNKEDSLLWKKKYGLNAPWWEIPTAITLLRNGNIAIGSSKFEQNLPNMRSNTWLLEIDGNGAMVRQWSDNLNTMEAKALKQTQDGGFIYASKKIQSQDIGDAFVHTTIVKMDSSFTKQWVFEGSVLSNSFIGAEDIEELQNGDFLICGNGNYINPNHNLLSAWIMKLHSDGSVAWSRGYTAVDTDGVENYLNDIDVLSDGSYVAVGYTNLPSSIATTQSQQAWMLKIDSNGCEIENCLLGISPQTPEGGFKDEIQVQPNPANGSVQLTIGNEMIGGVIILYNITGALVLQQKAEAEKTMLNINSLQKGLYIVVISRGTVNARAKLVVD